MDTRSPIDKSLANKLRSHTIPGDIHSMHKPDPIAADILRKEPEQEQFVRLIVSPTGNLVFFIFVLGLQN